MTGFSLGDERKDWLRNDPPGTLHLQPGLSCCPVLAAQTCLDHTDTACKRRAAADRCIDFSRAERNLTENQKPWELWRKRSLAVLSECCYMVVMLTCGSECAQPCGKHHTGALWGYSYTCQARTGPELQGGGSELPSQAAGFWGSADLWKELADHHYYYQYSEWFTSCCKNVPSPPGKITTTIGHHSSLCSSHQPLHSFCFWECYNNAKNNLWTWGNNAGNILLVLWGNQN